jgi:GxxExxY protein
MLVKDPLVQKVIGCAIAVHRELGPGLLESTYKRCLCWELSASAIAHESEVPVPLKYRGMSLDCGYRIDLVVEGWLVLEIKSVAAILPIHIAQTLTYVRLFNSRQGLIINFNAPRLKDGIRSVIPRAHAGDDSGVVASQEQSDEASDAPGSTPAQNFTHEE